MEMFKFLQWSKEEKRPDFKIILDLEKYKDFLLPYKLLVYTRQLGTEIRCDLTI